MKTETTHNVTLPKIGFGTAKVGGNIIQSHSREAEYLAALRSALELGYTHFDTAEIYALGYAEELIGRAIREMGTKRENLFITSKVWPTNLSYKGVLRACENSLRRLGTDYLDLYLVHWPNPFVPLKGTFRALNQLVRGGRVRHVGVSNFDVKRLKEAGSLSETPIIANQIPYSLTARSYVQNGALEYCQQNDILVTAYTPVDHGHLQVHTALETIAEAHGATIYQIALAWLVNQPRVITIPMSFDPIHIKENFAAAEIVLSEEEMKKLY